MNKMRDLFFDTDFAIFDKKDRASFFGKDLSSKYTSFKERHVETMFSKDFVSITPLLFSGKRLGLDTNVRHQKFYSSRSKLLGLLNEEARDSLFSIDSLF